MKRWLITLGVVAALILAAGAWLLWSARAVVNELSIAREHLESAQRALTAQDINEASHSLNSASANVMNAAAEVAQPVWALAEAIPKLGDTPTVVHGIVNALELTVQAASPAAEAMVKLDPEELVQQGRLDLSSLQAALPLLSTAQSGVGEALKTLSVTPQAADGALVVRAVDSAQQQLRGQLLTLNDTLASFSSVASLAPPLMGVSSPKKYFVAILNPNENRGSGGFMGTWAVVQATQGKLTVEEVGSNTDLRSFSKMPIDLGKDFENRYGADPALVANFNLSPHFPNGAKLWLTSYESVTGKKLDGVLSADIVALGDIVTASGVSVPLPDGATYTGKQLTDFALFGIYQKFPEPGQGQQRKEYQEFVAIQALKVLTTAQNPAAVLKSLMRSVGERRVMLYSTDPEIESDLLSLPIGGGLGVAEGPNVLFAPINVSASKLDTWLTQKVEYQVGRCSDTTGMVRSQVDVLLTNDIPKDLSLPSYITGEIAGEAPADGPTNRTLAQLHLPIGAIISSVTVDGMPTGFTPFTEQGRPAVVLDVLLAPRVPVDIQVFFSEPASGRSASLVVQPLATDPQTRISERTC